jgi:hypothetical protein
MMVTHIASYNKQYSWDYEFYFAKPSIVDNISWWCFKILKSFWTNHFRCKLGFHMSLQFWRQQNASLQVSTQYSCLPFSLYFVQVIVIWKRKSHNFNWVLWHSNTYFEVITNILTTFKHLMPITIRKKYFYHTKHCSSWHLCELCYVVSSITMYNMWHLLWHIIQYKLKLPNVNTII